ncbi:cytochrome oxidase putative small subunit CydP [Chitinimonas lacunae]|uniref:Cytochrome oxidase putative small subunit CydP n=1 Tax=Chitinimonas lacunae TaxID=1963018 RepID=A0ABV8MU34_9NEIS
MRTRPLWRELLAILVVKCLLLWAAKTLWFSDPLARHMQVPPAALQQRLLDPLPPPGVPDHAAPR